MAENREENIYEILVDLWRKERRIEGLAKIPEKLPEKLREYVSGVRQYLRVPDKESLSAELKEEAASAVAKLMQEIFGLRMRKLIQYALKGEMPENLFDFEKNIYSKLVSILKEYREHVKDLVTATAYQDWEQISSKYEVVYVLKDIPPFVGPNLEVYGPYKAGDLAALPPENASNLELANLVRIIRILQPRD